MSFERIAKVLIIVFLVSLIMMCISIPKEFRGGIYTKAAANIQNTKKLEQRVDLLMLIQKYKALQEPRGECFFIKYNYELSVYEKADGKNINNKIFCN